MKAINANNFIEAWKGFIDKEIMDSKLSADLIEKWNNDTLWTELIIGSQKAIDESPLGKHLTKGVYSGFKYYPEFNKIDLIMTSQKEIVVNDLNGEITKETGGYYPSYLDILIEHENKIELCWQEMYKLTGIKARLKVLIIYNYDQDKNGDYSECLNIIKKNFTSIIKQANDGFRENPETEYVLIIGQKMIDNSLMWDYSTYSLNEIIKDGFDK
jgi:hypothetical protein